jgi:hypothetical protein
MALDVRSIKSFPFEVKEVAPRKENFDGHPDNTFKGVRVVEVPWEKRFIFIQGMYLQSYPDLATAYVTSFEIVGVGAFGKDPNDDMKSDKARITLNYTTVDQEGGKLPKQPGQEPPPPNDMAEVELDFAQDSVEVPDGTFVFPDNTPANDVQRRIGMVVIRITANELDVVDKEQIADAIGQVNREELFGFAAGRVLLDSGRARRGKGGTELTANEMKWTLTVEYLARSVSWNELPHPNTGRFERVENELTGNTLYEEADIAAIIDEFVDLDDI